MNGYDNAVDLLRIIRKGSADFEKYCQAMKKKSTGNLDLQSLIILPVQSKNKNIINYLSKKKRITKIYFIIKRIN